jgi:hypothetical protein
VHRNNKPADLEGLWFPNPGFLVGGGPSIRDFPVEQLKDRGVVSMGMNLAAAAVHCRAWSFSDTPCKFHHALYLDPAIMTFAPEPKLKRRFMIKGEDGAFRWAKPRIRDCPNTYGFCRRTCFVPETFFIDWFAHWGPGKHQPKNTDRRGTICQIMLGIRLMHYLGCRRIYLLGVDYKGRDGKCYGYPAQKRDRRGRYEIEKEMLIRLQPVMARVGLEIFNLNPWQGIEKNRSALDIFPWADWDDAIADCKGIVPHGVCSTEGWYSMKKTKAQANRSPEITPMHFPGNQLVGRA